MKLPAEIEKEYILQAVESYKTKGLPPLCNEDTMYKVVIDGEEFPPPAIAKYAFHHKFGEWPEEFDGGLDSDCFSLLESCGYKIISKSKVNERYLELEEFVFNHLMKKNKESGLTFSVRQRAGKDSELDHFIGTADSNYSGFSLWNIAVDKFLATDVIDFIFKEIEKDKFSLSFQFIVNRSDDSEQNKATVMLGDLIKEELRAKGFETNLSKEGSAHYKIISALNPSEFDGHDSFIKGLDKYLEVYGDIVNRSLKKVKAKIPDYKADVFSKEEFEKLIKRLERRREKYAKILGMKKTEVIDNKEAYRKWLVKRYGESGTPNSYVRAIERLSKILATDLFKSEDTKFLLDLYSDLVENQRDPNSKYFDSTAKSYSERGFYSAAVKAYEEFISSGGGGFGADTGEDGGSIGSSAMNFPLNTIFYGPPGTGKTYNTLLRAVEIIEDRKIDSYKEALTLFNGYLHDQIEFITFHQNYSYEDFIQGLRPDVENDSELTFERRDGIFKVLADRALKKHLDADNSIDEQKPLNYVIIIDEINRANISRVFGELITLIEPDKRSHGKIPLEAKLPSGESFIVPSNLYIIGTMNTADKSIALLDIALRRRFEFEPMYPKYAIDDQQIYDTDILKAINKQIIETKGHDFQIGHAYFMGEENKDLIKRMNKKVIPLLLEYYMNDEKEVKGILNKAGLVIEEDSWPLRIK